MIRIVKHMPYVSNYDLFLKQFIQKEMGGDGDPLDVILIGERFQIAQVL